MNTKDSVTEFSVRQVFGIGGLLWAVRYWWRRTHAQRWEVVPARVEAREFLRFATNAGWFSVSYSYVFGGGRFSGELRKWMISTKTSKAESDPDTIEFSRRFPVNMQLQIRVDPSEPAKSVVDGPIWGSDAE